MKYSIPSSASRPGRSRSTDAVHKSMGACQNRARNPARIDTTDAAERSPILKASKLLKPRDGSKNPAYRPARYYLFLAHCILFGSALSLARCVPGITKPSPFSMGWRAAVTCRFWTQPYILASKQAGGIDRI